MSSGVLKLGYSVPHRQSHEGDHTRLIFEGKAMNDDDTVRSYGIRKHSKIMLVMKLMLFRARKVAI